jgi:hypothetical protein
MNGEFNSVCGQYYKLEELFNVRTEQFAKLYRIPTRFKGQKTTVEIDKMIARIRMVQTIYESIQNIMKEKQEAENDIRYYMEHFKIPIGYKLTGWIENEVEFKLWIDEYGYFHLYKTKDLLKSDDPNIILIKVVNDRNPVPDDDEIFKTFIEEEIG